MDSRQDRHLVTAVPVESHVVLKSADAFGDVLSGRITLQAPLKQGYGLADSEGGSTGWFLSLREGESIGGFADTIGAIRPDGYKEQMKLTNKSMRCLRIIEDAGLIIEKLENTGEWERLGHVTFYFDNTRTEVFWAKTRDNRL